MKPTLLLILDGYGIGREYPGNAALLAKTPCLDKLMADPVRASLQASGEYVGLPSGFIGNSEVGHLNIGAGRVVLQDMMRVNAAIENGEFFHNPVLLDLCSKIRKSGGRLHLLGLLSDGGVHSHICHVQALVRFAEQQHIPTLLHAFMDGRDTSPTSGVDFAAAIQTELQAHDARLATICGRFYAMDRDKRWERVQIAWDMLTAGKGERDNDAVAALKKSYALGKTDEFVLPHVLLEGDEAQIKSNDGVFFFNFRADRARELMHAFVDNDFGGFPRSVRPELAGIAGMTKYEASLPAPAAFEKEVLVDTLGECVAKHGMSQLRIAETEKYAHVTYFYSGGREAPFPLENRVLVPSPKDVPTYDLKPQMSAEEVTDKLISSWNTGKYQYVVCNLANPDMVGHTGNIAAAVKACEVVDACVQRIEHVVLASDGILCVTADHGNVEEMLDAHGKPQTAHTMNLTPLILEDKNGFIPLQPQGKLGDIAPTILSLWKMPAPASMTGVSLLWE